MEKQGMVRRKRFFRSGLLTALLLAASLRGGFLYSQEGADIRNQAAGDETVAAETREPLPEIRIETSPANPAVNSPWFVYLLVNHSNPQEVKIKPPRFPSSLTLERVRTETRLIERSADTGGEPSVRERWTRVEFLLTPQRAGAVTLEPFEVTVLGRLAFSGTTNVRFREERAARRFTPRFRWAGPAPSAVTGKPVKLILDLGDWDQQLSPPGYVFRGRAPANAILEEDPPEATGEGTYRYTVTVIPFEGNSVALGPFSFQAESYTLNVPGITVPVQPAPEAEAAPGDQTRNLPYPAEELTAPDFRYPPGEPGYGQTDGQGFLPGNRGKIFPFFQGEYSRIVAEVESLWNDNRRTEALAEIRRNERDSLSGPFLVPLRREMEQTMGLGFTDDERWHPLKISIPVWLLLGLLLLSAVAALLLIRPRPGSWKAFPRNNTAEKPVTFRRRNGFKTVIVLTLSILTIFIVLEEGVGNFLINRLNSPGKSAILESTAAYRVPDLNGAINARFGEGQPVIVGDYRGDWCYAESPDGRAGWVPRKAVIIY